MSAGTGAMRRSHTMPHGAQWLPGTGTRFRLWAPSAEAGVAALQDKVTDFMKRRGYLHG